MIGNILSFRQIHIRTSNFVCVSRATTFILLILSGALSVTCQSAYPQAGYGKLGFDDMNAQQQSSLWQQVDKLAVFEASMNVCGRRSEIKARVISAVKPCVTKAALDRVIVRWRAQIKVESQFQNQKSFNKAGYCADSDIRRLFDKYSTVVDNMVEKAKDMCTVCQLTGACH